MTQFEKWCKDNGYDPKGEFTIVPSVVCSSRRSFKGLTNETKVTVKRDEGTYMILGSFFINGVERLSWMKFDDLIQEKQLTQFDLTEFEKYCKDRGYDPKGEFKLTSDGKTYIKRINRQNICIVDKCLKVFHDDGTRKICFIFVDAGVRYWLPLYYLIQEKKDSMIDFDYKKALPVCWVRDREDQSWYKRWYVGNRDCIGYTVVTEHMTFESWQYITFEDPDEKVRENLKNQIREYECKIVELKEVLEKM